MAKKKQELTSEELLAEALVREEDWPYEVPGNWVWTRLGSVATFHQGIQVQVDEQSKEFKDNKIRFIRIIDYTQNSEEFRYVDNLKIRVNSLVDETDIVMVRYGASAGFIGKGIKGIVANNMFKIKVANSLKSYITLFLSSPNTFEYLNKAGGSSAMPAINFKLVTELKVPLPPLAEQQRIVERIESLFAKLDQAKDLIRDALDSFETRKAAILHQAFTGQLTKKWREAHGGGLESWEEDSLKNLCEVITDGTHQTPHYSTTGYVFLSSKNVTSGKIDWENIKYIPEELHNKLYARLAPQLDDILLAKNGTTGIGAIVDRDCVFDIYVSLALLRPIKCRITSKYLLYSINNPITKNKFNHELTGIGVQNLHLRDIRATTIPVPGLDEQQEIVRILDDLFAKEQDAKDLCDLIDQIDTIKKTILGQAFRGELGTNDPAEDSAVALLKNCLTVKWFGEI